MLFYLFSSEELGELFERLGYPFDRQRFQDTSPTTTPARPTDRPLSRVVHAWVLAFRPAAGDSLLRGSAPERCERYSAGHHRGGRPSRRHGGNGRSRAARNVGIREVTADVLRLNPKLPLEVERLDMHLRYRGHSLDLRLTRDALTVRGCNGAAPIKLGIRTRCTSFGQQRSCSNPRLPDVSCGGWKTGDGEGR